MAKAAKKIVFSRSRDIPFDQLVLSEANIRRVRPDANVEELTQDIERREDLIQGLNVRPVLDAEGTETGLFEVPAGGRRYRAIERLVKAKRFPKDGLVPCIVRDPGTRILAEDDSLAENVQRVGIHPLDQYRAFHDMHRKGMSHEEIAVAYFTTSEFVKQRLRLAGVSPILLDIYADDGMTLAQLEAFTVNPDHARQEQVWDAIQHSYNRQPWYIRQLLTETTVPASDKRARFIGIDAYVAAGGPVLRDLFQADEGGWLEDVPLLDRLVSEKLKTIADEIANEGWKWIAVDINLPYGYDRGLRAIASTFADLTDDERAARQALRDEYERIEAEHEGADELPDEIDQRLGEIETALEAFEKRPVIYDPAEMACAGVFVSIDGEGELLIDRGHVRPEDEAPAEIEGAQPDGDAEAEGSDAPVDPVVHRAVITIGGQQPEPEEEDEVDVIKPLSERLVTELTAERTLALRDKMANDPSVAFLAVLHKFCRDVFPRFSSYGPAMTVSVRSTDFSLQATGLKDTPAARAILERRKAWEERMPKDEDALWDWLVSLDGTEQAALFAHCAALGVNALYEKPNGTTITEHGIRQRLDEADRLARAVDLDMAEAGWKPTVENYLGRVPKARILAAVREGAGDRAADLIAHLKKGDMAKEAERLLADTGWLPEPLRLADLDADQAVEPSAGIEDGDETALPDFLAGDDDEDASDDGASGEEPEHLVAAE